MGTESLRRRLVFEASPTGVVNESLFARLLERKKENQVRPKCFQGNEGQIEREEEKKEKEVRTCDLPRPQAVLDHPDTVLAVGQGGPDS